MKENEQIQSENMMPESMNYNGETIPYKEYLEKKEEKQSE